MSNGRSELFGVQPAPGIDRSLLSQVLTLESNYRQADLKASPVRMKHLELSALLFHLYAGEVMTPEELVASIRYLPRKQFQEKFKTVAGATTDRKTGIVYVNTESSMFDIKVTRDIKKIVPFWSPLTMARTNYEHEWYHKAGLVNPKEVTLPIPLDKYSDGPCSLTKIYGFSMEVKKPGEVKGGINTSFEEVFAYNRATDLDKKLTGLTIRFNRLAHVVGQQAYEVNTGLERIGRLFAKRPDFEVIYQELHRESGLLEFGKFLASLLEHEVQDEVSEILFGLDLIMDIIDPPGGERFRELLSKV